jgi:hypothetical protein
LGFIDRIKAWFKRIPRATTNSSSSSSTSSSPLTKTVPMSEGELLIQEHDSLESERTRLRQEITMVESQYSNGDIGAVDRDRAYRMRLARAGRISMRQLEIRSQLVRIGHPIPDEWGAISIRR